MPAYSSHYIFAKEIMGQLSKLSNRDLNREAVFFGTQGPDIFFFHRVMPWMKGKSLRRIGSRLHRAKPSAIFDSMAEYVRQVKGDIVALSYAYGFICHYAMDKNVHPFVYGWQKDTIQKKPVLKGFTVHNRIEFAIDAVLIHDKLGIEKPCKFRTEYTVSSDKQVIERIAHMLVFVVKKVISENITVQDSETALRDLKYMEKITHDGTGAKTALLKVCSTVLVVKLIGYDPTAMIRPKSVTKCRLLMNDEKREWRNPNKPEEVRSESFNELFDVAKKQCLELVQLFNIAVESGDKMEQKMDNISFLTGLQVK